MLKFSTLISHMLVFLAYVVVVPGLAQGGTPANPGLVGIVGGWISLLFLAQASKGKGYFGGDWIPFGFYFVAFLGVLGIAIKFGVFCC